MSIHASCGHVVADFDDLHTVRIRGEDCDAVTGFHPCVSHLEYCPDCAYEIIGDPDFIETDAEADAWLGGQP